MRDRSDKAGDKRAPSDDGRVDDRRGGDIGTRTDADVDERTDAATLELDAADHALVHTLRALPPEGDEPDWKKLEAAIRAEVSPLAMPAPWWRNWRWLVPIGALATTAAIVMAINIRNGGDGERAANRMTMRDASVEHAADEHRKDENGKDGSDKTDELGKSARDEAEDARDRHADRAPAMWLDGEAAELEELSPDALDDLERDLLAELRDARATGASSVGLDDALGRRDGGNGGDNAWSHDDDGNDEGGDNASTRDESGRALGVLPAGDYRWIDTLRDDEAARLETFLARKRS